MSKTGPKKDRAGDKKKRLTTTEFVTSRDIAGIEDRIVHRISNLLDLNEPVSFGGNDDIRVAAGSYTFTLPAAGKEVDSEAVVDTLFALAHIVRMKICLLASSAPIGVTIMKEKLGLGTTGQVYHHLRILLQAGWLEKVDAGGYQVPGWRRPQFFAVVAVAGGNSAYRQS